MSASETAHPIWGYVDTVYVCKADIGRMWVVSTGMPPGYSGFHSGSDLCGESAWRSWERAMREADYIARKMRYDGAQRRRRSHECETCEGRDRRTRQICPRNGANVWLRFAQRPIPPEWDEN
jgi:hypothetical protein